jgi:hypothetical protein
VTGTLDDRLASINQGYVAIARIIDGEPEAQVDLAKVRENLAELSDGPAFVEQLDTALTVFRPSD